MNLTSDDLHEIRNVIESALTRQSSEIVKPIQNELQGLRSDIKEIYDMLSELESKVGLGEQFSKLTLEQKLLKLNTELLAAAKQAGISLPR